MARAGEPAKFTTYIVRKQHFNDGLEGQHPHNGTLREVIRLTEAQGKPYLLSNALHFLGGLVLCQVVSDLRPDI